MGGGQDLYGLPLDEFTAARDALAKELRKAGDEEGAAEVKARRKPSVASWAVNQAARRHRSDVERLLAAGAASREAQDQALAGDAGALRDATRTLNEEVERVAGLAAGELEAAGRDVSPAIRDRIATNLRAAAVDDEGGRLQRGVLAEDLEPTGFGGFKLAEPPSGVPPPPVRRPPAPNRSKEEDEALAAARRELRRAEAEAEAATARARRRAERAEAAERQAIEAHRAAEAARVEAEEAAGEAEAARRRAEEAAARLAESESQ